MQRKNSLLMQWKWYFKLPTFISLFKKRKTSKKDFV